MADIGNGFFGNMVSQGAVGVNAAQTYMGQPGYVPGPQVIVQNPTNPYAIQQQDVKTQTPWLDTGIKAGGAVGGMTLGHQLSKKLGANSVFQNIFGAIGGVAGYGMSKEYVDAKNQAAQTEMMAQQSQILGNLNNINQSRQQQQMQPSRLAVIGEAANLPLLSNASIGFYTDRNGNPTDDRNAARHVLIQTDNPYDMVQILGNALKPLGVNLLSVNTSDAVLRQVKMASPQIVQFDLVPSTPNGEPPLMAFAVQLGQTLEKMTGGHVTVPIARAESNIMLVQNTQESNMLLNHIRQYNQYSLGSPSPQVTAQQIQLALDNTYRATATNNPASLNFGAGNAAWIRQDPNGGLPPQTSYRWNAIK